MEDFKPVTFTFEVRKAMEKKFKFLFNDLELEFSPAFNHYYIYNIKTKRKTSNVSLYELYTRLNKF